MEYAIAVERWKDLETYYGRWEEAAAANTPMDRMLRDIYKPVFSVLSTEKIEYLYFGASFCELKIPTPDELKNCLRFCESRDLKPVLVTPPVTDWGIAKIRKLLQCISEMGADCELVINDPGILMLAQEMHFSGKLWLGRMMDCTIHDSRITSREKREYYSAKGYEYMKNTAATAAPYAALMEKSGVTGINVDYSSEGRVVPDRIQSALVYPTEFITTGRMCWYRIAGQSEEDRYSLGQVCQKKCLTDKILLWKGINYLKFDENGRRVRNYELLRKGNTVFHCHRAADLQTVLEKEYNNWQRVIFDLNVLF